VLAISCGGKQQAPRGAQPGSTSIQARLIVNGLSQPVDLQSAPGDTNRLFIVEKPGIIRVFRGGALLSRPFLDISSRVSSGSVQGLLGLAFHPL